MGAQGSDRTDDENPVPAPTSGCATRRFRGADHAEMLRRLADYLDERNPGRTLVVAWAMFDDDEFERPFIIEAVIDYDEDAYVYDDSDDDVL